MQLQSAPELINISSSSDESPATASTPIKPRDICTIETLNLSDVSVEPLIGSANDDLSTSLNKIDISSGSGSISHTDGSPRIIESFIPEGNKSAHTSSSYEEPDTPPLPLMTAPVLKDVTNSPGVTEPKRKKGRREGLNDLEDVASPSSEEENHLGVDFTSPILNCT